MLRATEGRAQIAQEPGIHPGDADLDLQYTALFRELLTYMMESPQQITACTHLMFIAKNLERIGDLAALRARFVEEGVFVRPFGNIIYLTPSFTIAPDELSRLTSAIVKVVGQGRAA